MSRRGGARNVWLSALVLTAALATAGAMKNHASDAVRITNGQWAPYMGEDEPHYGIASRIVTAAFENVGIDVEYGFFPWARSLFLAERGEWDGTAVWFSSEERRQNFYISDPVIISEYVFFHSRDMEFDWEEPADLGSYQIGTTRDYYYGGMLEEAEESGIITTEIVSSDELNFQKLAAGRIDLFPIDRVVGLHMIETELSDEQAEALSWHPRPISQASLHLLLSREVPENEERMKAFNEGLEKLRDGNRIEHFLTEALGDRARPGSLAPEPD